MGTYYNCYDIIADIRRDINEYSESYVQGSGDPAFSNELITQKINIAQIYLYNLLFKRKPHHFRKEVDLTAVNSVFTLPADFGELEWFKNENGVQVHPIGTKDITLNGISDLLYYRKGNTLVLEKSGSTKTYTLYYRWKPRKIFSGKAAGGGSASITFPDTASKVADYYNDMTIENITKDWVDTIDDYSTARVATISETAAKDDYFGLVPDLPEPFHHLIAPRASMLLRASSPLAKNRVTKDEKEMFNEDLVETLRAFAGSSEDVDMHDLFSEYQIGSASYGIIATS